MRFVLSILVFLPLTMLARDYPRVEVFGGDSYLHIDTQGVTGSSLDATCNRISPGFCPSGTFAVHQNANGWGAAGQVNVNRWLGLKADFSGNYVTLLTLSPTAQAFVTGLGVSGLPPKTSAYSFLFGPVGYKRIQRYNIFAHALVGANRFSTGTITIPPIPPQLTTATPVSLSNTGLAVAFGSGFDVKMSDQVSLRIGQVDYLYTQHNFNLIIKTVNTHQNNLRASAGVVFAFGEHPQILAGPARLPRAAVLVASLGLAATTRDSADGAKVVEVAAGSVAEQAGLRIDDVVNTVDGKPVRTATELVSELSGKAPGSNVRIGFLRRGYWQTETVVILAGH